MWWPLKRTAPATRAEEILDEYLAGLRYSQAPRIQEHPAIRDADAVLRGELIEAAVARLVGRPFSEVGVVQQLLGHLLRTSPQLTGDQLLALERQVLEVEQKVPAPATTRRIAARLRALIDPSLGPPPFDPDAWGASVIEWLAARDPAWTALANHAAQASGARPTARWARRAAELVAALDARVFAERIEAWATSAKLGPGANLSERNEDVLKGLIWACGSVNDTALAYAIATLGERCFKKIPGFGPASKRIGNACIHALSVMPAGIGVVHLSRLSEKMRYAQGKRFLDHALDGAAERSGQTREDLEELAVPRCGLDANSTKRVALGAYHGELSISDRGVEVRWIKPDGTPQASVPKALDESHRAEVKLFTKERKQVEALVAGQVGRLQRLWLHDRRLPLGELRSRYLEHPIVGPIARKLIWSCDDVELFWDRGELAALDADRMPDDASEARLWHTIDCSDLDRLSILRDLVETRGIVQPFKQVWREVYRPRTPGATADDRFAGHVIRQHAFRNLCKQRGWRYDLQGTWDSANTPRLALPTWNLFAELDVEPVAHEHDDSVFTYLGVGSLTFHRGALDDDDDDDDDEEDDDAVPLETVPPLVFSEVMRDVDLFVGVASVANDPSFEDLDHPAREYWDGAVFGDLAPLAETRGEVLARVLPRTILRDRARVEGRWLVVEGTGGASRIHLGTGNVQARGSNRPRVLELDNKARSRAASVFLPFEGDSILTDIIAKALVLAGE